MISWQQLDKKLFADLTVLPVWYHLYGAGAALMGLGLGVFLFSGFVYRPGPGWGRWCIVSSVVLFIGAGLGEWAHRRLMRRELNRA